MNKIQPNRELCAYCQSPKTTDDHIPPRNIFSGDRTNLITVPSCDEHNAKRSHLDERFRNYVAMRVGGDTPTTKTLWGKMVRGIQKNKKFQEKFRRNSLWRPELNAFEVEIESDAFKPGFVNTNTGYFGLRVRAALRQGHLRQWIKHSTLYCGHEGSTTVALKANPNPTRAKFDLKAALNEAPATT
jgi:hypothetical protein